MNRPMLRRQFLATAGGAAIVAPAAANVFATPNAAEADQTGNQARLFAGCCAYSYLKYFNAGSMTMESFIQKAVELGVRGVDITTYWLKSTEPEYLTSLRHLASKNGVSLSGIAIRTEMCQAGGAIRAEEVRRIQQWVDAAELLGASHVRVFAGNLPGGATEKQGIEWVVEAMKPACDYAAKWGITLGIENHGGMTARAATTLEILRRVDSPYRAKRTTRCIRISRRAYPMQLTLTSAIFLAQQNGQLTWTVFGGFSRRANTRGTCPRNTKGKKIRRQACRNCWRKLKFFAANIRVPKLICWRGPV